MKVAEFVSASGDWEWSKFALLLLESICLRIASILPLSNIGDKDSIRCHFSKNGAFTVKSTYNSLVGEEGSAYGDNDIWKPFWKWKGER